MDSGRDRAPERAIQTQQQYQFWNQRVTVTSVDPPLESLGEDRQVYFTDEAGLANDVLVDSFLRNAALID